MTLAEAIKEARALDARGGEDVADVLRAMELDTYFCEAVDAEPGEERQVKLAQSIIRRLYGPPQSRLRDRV